MKIAETLAENAAAFLTLIAERDAAIKERDELADELDRLNHLDVLSLQLPDGSVPAGIEQGLRSWHSAAVERGTVVWTLKEKLAVVQRSLDSFTTRENT